MAETQEADTAVAELRPEGKNAVLVLGGVWRITGRRPNWPALIGDTVPGTLRLTIGDLAYRDTSLALFVHRVESWCRERQVPCELGDLPDDVRAQIERLEKAGLTVTPHESEGNFITGLGTATLDFWKKTRQIVSFVGECVLSALYLIKRPHRFRWGDCLEEMLKCGAMALPIISLINGLVGLTLGYTGAVILRQFGADIWVADLVGLSMVREMGPVMTGIVLAGRTGAAFAAQLGNMKGNEEIDALETLGIRPIDFLVMPRMVALALMMPLLALYGNALGILGGMIVATTLDIPPSAYWIEMQSIVDLSDVVTGLVKASTFGILVGMAGCLRGLQAERSAAGVGQAATSAVVTGILLIIVWDAIYAVVFNLLGV